MNAGPQAARLDRGTPTLAERATAILRDEIANGALANIAAASQGWTAHRRGLITPEMTRGLEAEFVGLRDAVLDLIAPPATVDGRTTSRPAARTDQAVERAQPKIEPLPSCCARCAACLPAAQQKFTLACGTTALLPFEMGFVWSDLVAEPDGRIHSGLPSAPTRTSPSSGRWSRRPRDWSRCAQRRAARTLPHAARGHRTSRFARAAHVSGRS